MRRALARSFDDAADIAQVLVDQPRDPTELPERQPKLEMIGEAVIRRADEMERQQAAESARRNVRDLGFTFD